MILQQRSKSSLLFLAWQNRTYCSPVMPSTTRLSLVRVPVLSKQQTSTLPANGILNGSVQNTSNHHTYTQAFCYSGWPLFFKKDFPWLFHDHKKWKSCRIGTRYFSK